MKLTELLIATSRLNTLPVIVNMWSLCDKTASDNYAIAAMVIRYITRSVSRGNKKTSDETILIYDRDQRNKRNQPFVFDAVHHALLERRDYV